MATLKEETKRCARTGRVYVVRYGFDGYFAAQHSQSPHLSVTGEEWDGEPMRHTERNLVSMGCLHDMICREFPHVAPLVPFHLSSIDGPMHYVANTVWHAGDRDAWGLRKGERRQIRNGATGLPSWQLRVDDGTEHGADLPRETYGRDSAERPTQRLTLAWFPWCRIGDGKVRDLDAARRSAVWPDATDAELVQEPEALRAALLARLPALLDRMRATCAAAGIAWPNADGTIG